ncbi:MAG: outer membrane beta-barrel protein, partial [Cytophagales bacterium]
MKILIRTSVFLAIGAMPLISEAKGNKTEDSTSSGKLTISGYTDSYYFKNLNNPLSGGNAGNSGYERIFDQKEGQFQLGLAQTKFTYSTDKSEIVLDLTFGPNADMGNFGNFTSLNASGQSTNSSTAMSIKQAYWTYKATEKLSFTAGQFGTHIGYEVIDAPVNYNYSLSNLFGNGPFYHIGAKANYAF